MGVLECIKLLDVSYECGKMGSGVVFDGARNIYYLLTGFAIRTLKY